MLDNASYIRPVAYPIASRFRREWSVDASIATVDKHDDIPIFSHHPWRRHLRGRENGTSKSSRPSDTHQTSSERQSSPETTHSSNHSSISPAGLGRCNQHTAGTCSELEKFSFALKNDNLSTEASRYSADETEESTFASRPTPITNGDNAVMRAITDRQWNLVVKRAKEHPKVVSKYETMDLGTNRVRIFPVHYACASGAPRNVIKALAKAAPETLSYADRHGHTLLHWVIDKSSTSPDTIQTILKYCPESALLKCGKDGALPIHLACRRGDMSEKNHQEIVKHLIEAYPDGLFFKDEHRGSLPLHIAVKTGAPATIINILTEACPAAAAVCDTKNRLPLHFAVRSANLWSKKDAAAIIASLAEVFPGGLKRRDKSGYTPLTTACAISGPSESLVNFLLQRCPEAASTPDFDFNLPIHIAMSTNASSATINTLIDAYPHGVAERDKDNNIPLHTACTFASTTLEVLMKLLDTYPQGATIKNKDMLLPLHLALESGASEDIVRELLYCYPEAARFKGRHGMLPIHIACKNISAISSRTMEILLLAYSDSLSVKDDRGRLPIDCLPLHTGDSEVFSILRAGSRPSFASEGRGDMHVCEEREANDGWVQHKRWSLPGMEYEPLDTLVEEEVDGSSSSSSEGGDDSPEPILPPEPLYPSIPESTIDSGKEAASSSDTCNEDPFSMLQRLHEMHKRYDKTKLTLPVSKELAANECDDITVNTTASYYICRGRGDNVKILRGC